MIGRRLAVLVCTLTAAVSGGVVHGADSKIPDLLEPRVVSTSIDGLWLDRIDVSLRLAVRSGRDLTIRSVSFTDAFVENIPVWIAPLDGDWRLRKGEDLEIPRSVIVSASALDALGTNDFSNVVRDGVVDVRALVEVAFATPWPARMLMQPPAQIAITPVEIRIPISSGPSMLQPFTRLGASVVDLVQREAAPFLIAGRNALPSNRAVLDRFERSVVTVTTNYTIEKRGELLTKSTPTTGFWWTPGVLCTTREAFEPWRFDAVDALLQATGGRLRSQDVYTRISSSSLPSSIDIDFSKIDRQLGSLEERRVFVMAQGKPQRIRLADRDASSNLACVLVPGAGEGGGGATALDESVFSAAAFALGRSRGLVWTDVLRDEARLILRTPVYRYAFGSPLVTPGGVAGIVVSSTTAWDVHALASVAAHAPRVAPRASPVRGKP